MSLTLDWNNEQSAMEIGDTLVSMLEELLKIAAAEEGVEDGEVVLSFVDDETIRELNRQYRNIDKATDVLSFSMLETVSDEPSIIFGDDSLEESEETAESEAEDEGESYIEPIGDIVISVPRAIEQAEEYGHSVERELGFLFVHGFLHLIGYDHDHEEAEREMFAKQEAVLQKAGLTR